MKQAKIPQFAIAPENWSSMPCGEYYCRLLEQQMRPWLAKLYGSHLLKIGNLSAQINTEACAIPHQVNISLQGSPLQVKANPLYLPFAEKSVDACLLVHILPWCHDPHRLLREADRVLIDNGWLILSGFNPISLMGLRKLVPLAGKSVPWNSRMFTLKRQLDWLALLNFEVLHYGCYGVLTGSDHVDRLLNTHLPLFGRLQLVVARKRTLPLTLKPTKLIKIKIPLRQALGIPRQ
ncbi:class I SAM-dependent methyltransferase [Enterobacteriaceae bacterium ESL0689]|nr:class I SAM-dependent methyltransferase [Enterobacteriaceae bacterium ESL0689]